MPVIRAAEAPIFNMPGTQFTGYTAPSRGAEEICTWRLQIEPGVEGEAHWFDHEEIFLLLEGTLTVVVAGEEIELAAGDALSVPARVSLQPANRGTRSAIAIVCLPVGAQATMASGQVFGTPPWGR